MIPLLLLAALGSAQAASKKDLQAQIDALQAEVNQQQAIIVELQNDQADAQSALSSCRADSADRDQIWASQVNQVYELSAGLARISSELAAPVKKGTKPDPRITTLQGEIQTLSGQVDELRQTYKTPASEEQAAATALLDEANDLYDAGDVEGARQRLATLQERYGNTRAMAGAKKLQSNIDIIGLQPGEPPVIQWFSDPYVMADHRVTVVVFWEAWCPHCKRELPRLAQLEPGWAKRGVGLLGLTRITKSSTPDTVRAFIKDNDIHFAMAQESGDWAKRFGVTGIPAAAVVVDGAVVWRGHPAQLTDETITRWAP